MSLGQLGNFEILERIGEGGMGVVYRARDVVLDRPVALKVLPERVSLDPTSRTRLMREARAEARLNHPNVAICYDAGEAVPDPPDLLAPGTPVPHPASVLYLAMEYVPGTDLATLLEGRPLRIREALDLALQIATGLEAAHGAGIIHRDLKPGNIRVTPEGVVKLLDFGLAQIQHLEETPIPDRKTSLTREFLVGTAQYMSPEQVVGGPLDAHSDLFSFGVVLFELVTGRTPFEGHDPQEIFYAVTNEEPPPLARYASGVPVELERIVHKLLQKRPQDRYQSAHEVVTDLRRLIDSSLASSPALVRKERDGRWRRRLAWAAGAAALAAAAAWLWWRFALTPGPGVPSVAVLEFKNRTGDEAAEYLAAGLAADVASDLVQYTSLNVAPASEVDRLTEAQRSARDAGRELGVRTVLTGVMRRSEKGTRLDAELVDCRSGYVRWSGVYDLDPEVTPAVKRSIVSQVAARLIPGGGVRAAAAAGASPPPEAYQAYLRGIDALASVGDPLARDRALSALNQAVELAPLFALAWAARARALWWLFTRDHDPDLLRRAEESADEAVRLAPSLLEARTARARVYRETGRPRQAAEELEEVLRVNPNWDEAWSNLGGAYRKLGDFERAEASLRKAVELRPASPRNWSQLGGFLIGRGDYRGARVAYQKVVDLLPDQNRGYEGLASAYILEGRPQDAITVYERLPQKVTDGPLANNIASAYFYERRMDKALQYFLLAVSLQPADQQLRVGLGDCYARMKRLPEAQAQYREAVRLSEKDLNAAPGDGAMTSLLILNLAKAGECPRMLELYQDRHDVLPVQDAEIQYRVAKALAICGRKAESIATLRRMVRLGASPELFRREDEFLSLRGEPAFEALVTKDVH